jgi:hypothetical protein
VTVADLLEDLTSGDPTRIWSASCAVIHLHDPAELDRLASQVGRIRASTREVPLGGMLFPNAEHLAAALRRIDQHASGAGCACGLYPGYLMYNPRREAEEGRVVIESEVVPPEGWAADFVCRCTRCGARYQVEEREYHYTWWGWRLLASGGSR